MIAHFVGQDAADSGFPCLALPWLGLSLSFGLFMPLWPAMRPTTTTTTMLFSSSSWLPSARFVLPLLRLLCLFSLSLLSAVAVCQPKLLHSKLSISQQQGKSCNFQLSPQLLAVSPSLDLPRRLSLSLSSDLPAVRNYTAATSFLISCRTFSWHFCFLFLKC